MSAWTKFATQFFHNKQKNDPDYKFSQALKQASPLFKKMKKGGSSKKQRGGKKIRDDGSECKEGELDYDKCKDEPDIKETVTSVDSAAETNDTAANDTAASATETNVATATAATATAATASTEADEIDATMNQSKDPIVVNNGTATPIDPSTQGGKKSKRKSKKAGKKSQKKQKKAKKAGSKKSKK